jgi:NAD(P)-dependent dehydrogenase (short-subunit alcohol dehydrogenase family)
MSQLTGKTALITGGTTGIGFATAKRFYEAGAKVVITGSSEASVAAARRELPEDIVVLRSDVRRIEDATALAREIERRFGGLDVVFLNAGIAKLAPFEAVDEALYDELMDTNVKGVVFTLQKVLPLLRSGASVLVNASVVDKKGFAAGSIYSATKGAVAALVRSLAVELAGKGIRVNAISPGPVATPIFNRGGMSADQQKSFEDNVKTRVPLQRMGAADEIARAALFLASPAASYVTGADIPVDGGLGIA